jgi:predicted metal-dependent hydrolase
MQDLPVDIIRSPKRSRTASARVVDGRLVVRVPAGISPEEERELVDKLVPRVLKAHRKQTPAELPDLKKRAADLNKTYFGGKLRLSEIKWVSNQEKRYGSCTPSTSTIRISDRIATMPLWVLDYVIMHELSHLIEANHSPRFWQIVNRYPLTERARGYLMAVHLEDDAA